MKLNRWLNEFAAKCHHHTHWLEGLEPYDGKLSSTVLRGGRAGNSPLPLDLVKPKYPFSFPQ